MAWIESHQDLDKNGKVLELANRLGINRYQAIGHLHALWWWALDNAEDGDVSRFSSVTVTQACGWAEYVKDEVDLSRINEITNRDKMEALVPALIECGFLDKEDDGLWIHNWRDYTERYFKSVKMNKRIRDQVKRRVEKYRNSNANVTQVKRSVTVPTRPYQTLPNHKKTARVCAPPFLKPTIEQITAYAKEKGLKLDVERFFDHYEGNGWKVGRVPMRDWKATVRNWMRSEFRTEDKHGANDGKSAVGVSDIFKRNRESGRLPGLRKITEAGTRSVLDGLRDRAVDAQELAPVGDQKPVGG